MNKAMAILALALPLSASAQTTYWGGSLHSCIQYGDGMWVGGDNVIYHDKDCKTSSGVSVGVGLATDTPGYFHIPKGMTFQGPLTIYVDGGNLVISGEDLK